MLKQNFTNELKEKAKELHNRGYNLKQIEEEIKINYTSISKFLDEKGLRKIRSIATQQEKDEIIKLYKNGSTVTEISNKFHRNNMGVTYILRQGKVWKFKGSRKYICDFDFFEKIDTEEKAYWLGFIAADGNVTKEETEKGKYSKRCLHIGIHAKDEEHLKLFKKHIKATYPVRVKSYTSKGKPSLICRIDIQSQKIIDDLSVVGVKPAKSKTMDWNDFKVPSNLMNHFIRGYFDGDGSWSKAGKTKLGQVRIKFCISCGSDKFIFPLQEFLSNKCNISLNKIESRKDGNYALLWAGRQQMERIYGYMYHNATVFLKRKKDVAHDYLVTQIEKEEIPDFL